MESYLLEKLSCVSEEEKRLLGGATLNPLLYSDSGDFVINSRKLLGGEQEIGIRTHTRFATFPPHRHNGLEMMAVLSGKIVHHIGGETVTLQKGDILVMNRHIVHSIERAELPDVGVNLFLTDSFVGSLFDDLSDTVFSELLREHQKAGGAGVYLCFSTGGDKQIENILENTIFELTEYRQSRKILFHSVSLLFDYLSLKSEKMLMGGSRLPDRNTLRKSAVTDYIREHYQDGTLQELSSMLYLSVPYLSGQIQTLFHRNFKELLVEERIRRAQELIRRTQMPIGEIIRSVGYENASYFHREFQKRTGMTPLTMRKKTNEGR